MLGGGVYYTNIQSDSSFVFKSKNHLRNFQFGISAGYAYTHVFNKRYYLSGSVAAGINFGNETVDRIGKDRLEVYPSVFPRISTGYNHDKWSLGFSFVSNIIFPAFSENNAIGIISGNFQVTYTRRIENIPILTKVLNKIPLFW